MGFNVGYTKTLCKPERQNGERLDSLCMKRLPLGSVNCFGWLRSQLDFIREGITGRLPEFGPFFKKENNGFLYPETNSGWEEIPYWFRGFYPLAVLTGDEKLIKTAHEYIEAFIASKQPDGWFGPAYLKEYEKIEEVPVPDLYPAMLLLDTLIMYYEVSGDERIPELIGGFFGFCKRIPDIAFIPASATRLKWQKIRAGEMLSALYWYYEYSKDIGIIELAKRFYNAIYKSNIEYVAHHAVDFSHRFAYDAIYSRISGRKEHFEKSEYLYDSFEKIWGQMPRGIFATDERIRHGCTDPRQAFEPCGMVELAKNFYELGRISSLTLYADRVEDVMLNHFAPSFSEDYRQMHYLTSPNRPLLVNSFDQHTLNGSVSHDRSYEMLTPNNRCCGHNTGMGWTWYTANLWQESADGGLVAWLYAESEAKLATANGELAVREHTDYPFNGDILLTVTKAPEDTELPIYLRIPRWSTKTTVKVCGTEVFSEKRDGGYVCIKGKWNAGDTIEISFGMEISLRRWKNNGSVSVDRGPFTYSVKIGEETRVVPQGEAKAYDHPTPYLFENIELLPTSPWNYGLPADDMSISELVKVKEVKAPGKQPWSTNDAPIVLAAHARRIDAWTLQNDTPAELQQSPIYEPSRDEEIELIPLGCARLRMSCLPVVTSDISADAWKETPTDVPPEARPALFPNPYKA